MRINGNSARNGGGLYNNSLRIVTISASTISGNSANQDGGGIYNAGLLALADTVLLENTTGQDGGGIFNDRTGGLALAGGTIRLNAANRGGGIANRAGGVLAIIATDISDNRGGDLVELP
ncbi:MAG: hypothetical protein IRY99_15990 [Isosphaeraceae bacterium]|nr:hypothetical protein [Isosphaeraceae bacterium]